MKQSRVIARAWRWPVAALAAALVFATAAVADAPVPREVVEADSGIRFTSRQMGVRVEGGFARWQAEIAMDPDAPEQGSARIVIDTTSVDTGNSITLREARGRSWLDVEQYPEAVFESRSVRALDGGRYEAEGMLRIKDQAHSIAVPFSLDTQGDEQVVEGEFVIKRADFDVGGGMWADFDVVANEVVVRFSLRLAAP